MPRQVAPAHASQAARPVAPAREGTAAHTFALCVAAGLLCAGVAACGGAAGGAGLDAADGGGGGSSVVGASGGDSPAANEDAGSAPSQPSGPTGSAPDAGAGDDSSADGGGSGAAGDAAAPSGDAATLDPNVAPGGNFDLSIWELQEPFGSPGSPTTILPAQLVGAKGFQDTYFFTDPTDGAMSFYDPENGVTTANSNYPRSELREMTASGAAANWLPPGTHTMSATVKATVIPDHVAVGQIHLGTGTPASTKPLLELFYYADGAISLYIEQTPAGGNEVPHPITTIPLGTKWSYVIGLSGNTISLSINGAAAQTFAMSSTFNDEGMYFKAGDYDQSVGTDASIAAKVQFYALTVFHGP